MTTDEKQALIDLLFRLADDELMMGHRNSEWTGIAPILEEDIAFSSLAQDEIGHAQAYYVILHEHLDQKDPDKLAFLRDPEDFRNAEFTSLPRKDWARAIVRQFLYDAAEQIRHDAYREHPFTPLAELSAKIHGEEKYHYMHGHMWITKLGNGTEESRERLQIALDELWAYALGLFEDPTAEQSQPFDEESLRNRWLNLVCPVLNEAGLSMPVQLNGDQWVSTTEAKLTRYESPSEDRTELLDAMQKVYRLDPTAEW